MTTRTGFFRSALDAYMQAREKQAERYVAAALLGLDDETLRSHGYSRADLKKRAGAYYL
ncbi:hypothetical protein RB623_05400 [Mesorhizobium sp. LHD-90]|uniref:hypothetical protein n=1 Tax=Mesorhizobium sp. LHD-90 TaxID=3071414 RepID=UPI0027DEDE29|nr:hypothetical protein [Mesorhizobium sp. LHD-90]MDQ6433485.1 hypothetical protein [Mesorhizobium sp. LHD-90]